MEEPARARSIFVIGGTGRTGSHLVRRLCALDAFAVTVLARDPEKARPSRGRPMAAGAGAAGAVAGAAGAGAGATPPGPVLVLPHLGRPSSV